MDDIRRWIHEVAQPPKIASNVNFEFLSVLAFSSHGLSFHQSL